MGIGFFLYTTLMWLTKLDTTYLWFGQYLGIGIILLPIIILFFWQLEKKPVQLKLA